MAAIPVTITGVLADKYGRTLQSVTLFGEMSYSDRHVGGGPMPPGEGGGGEEKPPGIWGGPIDPYPGHPLPQPPGGGGRPPGIWGGPIDPYPGHPLPEPPTEPPTGEPDSDGFIKAPVEGGWGYHQTYQWLYNPGPTDAGPKR